MTCLILKIRVFVVNRIRIALQIQGGLRNSLVSLQGSLIDMNCGSREATVSEMVQMHHRN